MAALTMHCDGKKLRDNADAATYHGYRVAIREVEFRNLQVQFCHDGLMLTGGILGMQSCGR